jgi:hypothetical protein
MATPGPADAKFMDGKSLLNACTQPSQTPRRSICLGYIAAIADALEKDGIGRRKACFGKDAKLSAMRDTVVAHLKKQKTKAAEEPASGAVTVALVNRFSCR